MDNIIIRKEKEEDYHEVEALALDSFWDVYRPGCLEHYLLKELRDCQDFVNDLVFVMTKNDEVIGQVVFVKSKIYCDDGRTIPVLTLGPICVKKDFQGQGLGKELLDYAIEKAKNQGFTAIFLEGNINFYGKSGFKYASTYNIRYNGMGKDLDTSFFLCKELQEGILSNLSGNYVTPNCYLVDEEKAKLYTDNFKE